MPLNRLLLILATVISAAAITVYVAVSLSQSVAFPPIAGIAVLSIIALCASFALRRITDRKSDDT